MGVRNDIILTKTDLKKCRYSGWFQVNLIIERE